MIICYGLTNQKAKINLDFNIAKDSILRIIVLVSLTANSHLELVTTQNHLVKHGTSDLLCKAIVDRSSKFSYLGKVIISKKGNQAHAYQRNENLILDNDSSIVSEPSLEILANDVFCTHGSFTSYLDPQQLYYLQTRGINLKQAEKLLIRGFLLSGLDKLLIEPGLSPARLKSLRTKVSSYLTVKPEN